ncbi:UbiA prenyltransferase family [Crucibulum laeve]|uniref:4-hydroxybenzoate polyprenyltransferase, mitochondrial n=1 Tax=Crucibulum laeve TaxID=68775 RepID=A0A5C3LHC0_9AGAR|nr:UbiA prenyltransferase family [Crucibulum laeve]
MTLLVSGPIISSSAKFSLNCLPENLRPFLEIIRFDKPTGTMLMFWPFAWGYTMAAYRVHIGIGAYFFGLAKCFLYAFIVRSSACTINDIFDRNVDAQTERTKSRPLASGRISVQAAIIYLFFQYFIGVLIFWYTMKDLTLWVALFQLFPLFAIYPFLKRYTHWPQAWLGFSMNFGFITAWIMLTGTADVHLLALAIAGCWCWTMLYDTIYACQDMKDDVKIGVKSTAILFGSWIKPLLVLCAATFVTILFFVGALNNHGHGYFAVSVGGTAAHLIWQFMTLDLEESKSCWKNFNQNGHLGWIVWGGIFFDYLS